ncbi:photosystem II 5 kDa protein, chloroplastic-like [Solanum verrucosum]|nr:photosystem II 5 kDa protein, chloroplastic-like [Solanum verrucosum]XP_049395512.1 photosystem II 5 kDa protein, chloroplastic-like [Solanum stenotomum]
MASLLTSSPFLVHIEGFNYRRTRNEGLSPLSTHSKSNKRRVLKVNAFNKDEKIVTKKEEKKSNGSRRELAFALMAIVATSSFTSVVMAEEPKAGTLEAKKKYAPICVTMATARICHK